jgi:hypothetical protein
MSIDNESRGRRLLSEDRPAEIRAWCERARTATDREERVNIRLQLMLIGQRLEELGTDPGLLKEVEDAWDFMREQNSGVVLDRSGAVPRIVSTRQSRGEVSP